MYKHMLFFSTPEECYRAELWVKGNIEDISGSDVSYNGTVFYFYTECPLHDIEMQQITSNLAPLSFLSEQL
jgi:hypothetical protein